MRLHAGRATPLVLLVFCTSELSGQASDTSFLADSGVVKLRAVEAVASIMPLRGPQARSSVPARTVYVTGAELRAQRSNLADAISARPAAALHDDLGSPFKPTITMRGFQVGPVVGLPQGVSILVDGVPMNEPGAGEVNLDLLPIDFAEGLEVLSGTSSLLGPNSLGGAINIITERGGSEREARVEIAAGGHGLIGAKLEAGGPLGGMRYFAGVAHEQTHGWRARANAERTVVHTSVGRFGEGRAAGVRLTAGRSLAETAGSLPLSVYHVRPDSNLTAGDFELLRQVAVGAFMHAPLWGGEATARLFLRAGDAERFNANQTADPDVRGFTESRTAGFAADWTASSQSRRSNLHVRLGGGGLLNATSIRLYAERITPGLTTDVHSPISRADAYVVGGAGIGRVRATAGVRADLVRVPFRNRINAARDTTTTYVHVSPRAGVSFAPTRRATVYVSIARGFRPPALIEIACADPAEPCPLPFALGDDPPIDPVKVTTYEAGATWATAAVAANAAVYRSAVRDDIFLIPYRDEDDPDGSTIDGYFDNVARTSREGVEASLRAISRHGHRAFVTYTYARATFRTAGVELFSMRTAAGTENAIEKGDRFPLIPDHTVTAGIDFAIAERASAGALARYTGQRYLRGDEANNDAPLQAFTTVDLHAAVEVHGLELGARLRNATGTRYFAFGTYNVNQGNDNAVERFVMPGAPRTFEIALAAKLGP